MIVIIPPDSSLKLGIYPIINIVYICTVISGYDWWFLTKTFQFLQKILLPGKVIDFFLA